MSPINGHVNGVSSIIFFFFFLHIFCSNTSDHILKSKTTESSNEPVEQPTFNDIGIEIKSRPLERTGAGCNEGYFIDDRSEININFQKYRMVFVVNKDAVFYKKSAFQQARKV